MDKQDRAINAGWGIEKVFDENGTALYYLLIQPDLNVYPVDDDYGDWGDKSQKDAWSHLPDDFEDGRYGATNQGN